MLSEEKYFKFIHNKKIFKCPFIAPTALSLVLWGEERTDVSPSPWQKEKALLLIPPPGVKLPRDILEFHRGDTRDASPVQPQKATSMNVERGDC